MILSNPIDSLARYIPSWTFRALSNHKYKIAGLACGLAVAPFTHLGVYAVYKMYKFAYRMYYAYFLIAAIQSNTCTWISTPSVMLANTLINYAFDPETAHNIIKTIYWLSCKVVQGAESVTNHILARCGGVAGIKQNITNIYNHYTDPEQPAADFDVTFGKSDFDFVDVFVNPQDDADYIKPIVIGYDYCDP